MKKQYKVPSVKVVDFVTGDIIVTSNGLLSGLWSDTEEGVIDFSEWLKAGGENNE